MRRHCGHHIRHVYLSVRHRSHAPFHPVGIICGTGGQTQETPWHVANYDSDVPDRGRIHSALPRDSSHSGGRCALCKFLCNYSLGGDCWWANVTQKVGLNFMTYEFVRQYLTLEGEQNPSAVRKLAAGAISGAVAQTCTYPL